MSVTSLEYGSEFYKQAMLNANRADKDFIPLYIRNNQDVKKLLYLMKMDEEYKSKKK